MNRAFSLAAPFVGKAETTAMASKYIFLPRVLFTQQGAEYFPSLQLMLYGPLQCLLFQNLSQWKGSRVELYSQRPAFATFHISFPMAHCKESTYNDPGLIHGS